MPQTSYKAHELLKPNIFLIGRGNSCAISEELNILKYASAHSGLIVVKDNSTLAYVLKSTKAAIHDNDESPHHWLFSWQI